MLFQTELTIPANTAITAVVDTDLQLINGVINQVEVMFPPGSAGLAKVAIFHKNFRVWPSSPEQWFYADDYTFKWQEDFTVNEKPFVMRVVGYNEDTDYDHTVIVRLAMLTGGLGIREYLNAILLPRQQIVG